MKDVCVAVGGGTLVRGKSRVTVYAHLYSNYMVVDWPVGRAVRRPNLDTSRAAYVLRHWFAVTALAANVVDYSTTPALVDRVLPEELIVLRQRVGDSRGGGA